MFSKEQKKSLDNQVFLGVPMHDHSKTIVKTRYVHHVSTEAMEEGCNPLSMVEHQRCPICGLTTVEVKNLGCKATTIKTK